MSDQDSAAIFVHITKTGGTSVAKALGISSETQHRSAVEIRNMVGLEAWNRAFKFSFVRNPWDKMVSNYHFNHQRWVPKGTSFAEYIRLYADGFKVTRFPPTQLRYLQDETDDVIVDFVGQFERLQDDFNRVCDQLSVERRTLPHLNRSSHRHYREYYDVETRQLIADLHADEISYFDYKF